MVKNFGDLSEVVIGPVVTQDILTICQYHVSTLMSVNLDNVSFS